MVTLVEVVELVVNEVVVEIEVSIETLVHHLDLAIVVNVSITTICMPKQIVEDY